MTAELIDGKQQRQKLFETLTPVIAGLAEQAIKPGLAVVLVGQNPASRVYVHNKITTTKALGMNSLEFRRDETISQDELLALIDQLNQDPDIDGILVQLPLPEHIDEAAVTRRIDPAKDVDGFHPVNVAGLVNRTTDTLLPCTPHGVLLLTRLALSGLQRPAAGMHAVIVGRSAIVGKPMAMLLLHENMTVTIAHSKTIALDSITRQADVLVAAVGVPQLINAGMVKPGAVVMDVGINRGPPSATTGKAPLLGDVDTQAVSGIAAAITPVPGGVGPMTIAMLMVNTVVAACRRRQGALPESLAGLLARR